MDVVRLLQTAREVSSNSYSPYSHFPVGAALLCSSGSIYTGVNVENRSYGLTTCAERSALFTAISHGENQFEAIAVVTPTSEDPVPPCGACRQVLSEFVNNDFPIYFAGKTREYRTKTMGELLPEDSLHDLGGRS
jgi:cytidine deaminase